MSSSQDKILDNVLKNCVFDGWATDALEKACIQAGLDKNYWRVDFPGGAIDLLDYFNEKANLRMADEFRCNEPGVTAKIRAAVRLRLEQNSRYKQQLKTAIGIYALHPLRSTKAVFKVTDAMWQLAGDTATDWNYYSKRMLLSGVYTSTLMFWLDDKSENNQATWEFLDRRLAEVGKFNKGMGVFKNKIKDIKSGFAANG